MNRHLLFISICLFMVSCSLNNGEPSKEFYGIKVKRELKLYYKDNTISRKLLLINDSGLDGFWISYTVFGEIGRTQLYLNSIEDTSWDYANNNPIYTKYNEEYSGLVGYSIDTLELKAYLKERIKTYEKDNSR